MIAIAGDGAMQMNGINELITVATQWQSWHDPRLVVIVLNNRDLNMVSWEQRILSGEPKWPVSQAVPDFPYARYAELVGLRGIRLESPDTIAEALDEALAARGPVVLEAVCDPTVPCIPSHLSEQELKHIEQALRQPDPELERVRQQLEEHAAETTSADALRQLLAAPG